MPKMDKKLTYGLIEAFHDDFNSMSNSEKRALLDVLKSRRDGLIGKLEAMQAEFSQNSDGISTSISDLNEIIATAAVFVENPELLALLNKSVGGIVDFTETNRYMETYVETKYDKVYMRLDKFWCETGEVMVSGTLIFVNAKYGLAEVQRNKIINLDAKTASYIRPVTKSAAKRLAMSIIKKTAMHYTNELADLFDCNVQRVVVQEN